MPLTNDILTDSRLPGSWRCKLIEGDDFKAEEAAEGRYECFFRFFDDLRYVAFAEDTSPEAIRRWWPIRHVCSLDGPGLLRLRQVNRSGPPSEGVVGKFWFEEDTLMIESLPPRKRAKWRCRRLAPEEFPEWFEEECAKALARPWG